MMAGLLNQSAVTRKSSPPSSLARVSYLFSESDRHFHLVSLFSNRASQQPSLFTSSILLIYSKIDSQLAYWKRQFEFPSTTN